MHGKLELTGAVGSETNGGLQFQKTHRVPETTCY